MKVSKFRKKNKTAKTQTIPFVLKIWLKANILGGGGGREIVNIVDKL